MTNNSPSIVIDIIKALCNPWGAFIVIGFFLIIAFVFVYLISPGFRQTVIALMSRLKKMGKDGVEFDSIVKDQDNNLTDLSDPEIQPIQIDDNLSVNEETEESLFVKMIFNEISGGDLETLNKIHLKLKNLPNRKRTDEEVEEYWFNMRMFLNDSIEEELLALTESHPNWYFPYLLLTRIYLKIDATPQANKYLQEAFLRAHENVRKRELHYIKAEIIAKSDEDKKIGEKKAAEYLQKTENNSEWDGHKNYLFTEIATYQKKLGDKVSQQISLEKAINLDPTNIERRFNLAFSYAEDQHTYLLAIYHYDLLLRQQPSYTSAINNLAILYQKLGFDFEYDKLINKAMIFGSAHAKGNYVITLLEKDLIIEAKKILDSLSDEEKKDSRLLDAMKYLERNRNTQEKKIDKFSPLPELYKKYIDIAIDNSSFDPKRLEGVWKSESNFLTLLLNQNGKIEGQYTVESSSPLSSIKSKKEYNVSGDHRCGILEILCIEKTNPSTTLSTLLNSDTMSFRLVLNSEQLKGFSWYKNNMPNEVIFAPYNT